MKAPESMNKMEVMTVGELVEKIGRKFQGVNLLEVEKYLRDSKVSSYSIKCAGAIFCNVVLKHLIYYIRLRARSRAILSRP